MVELNESPGTADVAFRDDALTQVMTFARRFGPAHLTLALHAAVPVGLMPHLVHLLRCNFVPHAPWIAEADLLLSPLCREVGPGVYLLDQKVRELLLDELRQEPSLGPPRVRRVAELLLAYVDRTLRQTDSPDTRAFLLAQEWAGLAYLDPSRAAEMLAASLRDTLEGSRTADLLQVVNLVDALAVPLASEENFVLYTTGVSRLAAGDVEMANRFFEQVGDATAVPVVGSVELPAPRAVLERVTGTASPAAVPQSEERPPRATRPRSNLPLYRRPKPLRVYLSLYGPDVAEHRDSLSEAIRKLGHEAVGSEYFSVLSSSILDESDVFLMIVGRRRGWVPLGQTVSAGESEYRRATERGLPCLVFIAAGSEESREPHAGGRALADFKAELRTRHRVEQFALPDELAPALATALTRLTTGPQVFFSHRNTREVIALAERFAGALEREGYRPWLAARQDGAGELYFIIQEAIKSSRCMIIMLSPEVKGSELMLEELHFALTNKIPVIPVMIERCELPLELEGVDYVEMTRRKDSPEEYDVVLQRVMDTIDGVIGSAQTIEEPSAEVPSAEQREKPTDAEVIQKVAELYFYETYARSLLYRIGYPGDRIPKFQTADEFWRKIAGELQSGILPEGGGLRPLIEAAASMYPGNAVLRSWLGPVIEPASPAEDRGATIEGVGEDAQPRVAHVKVSVQTPEAVVSAPRHAGFPDVEDVAELPLRAAIAFAARCLRRVQELGPRDAVVARAIAEAEGIASSRWDVADPSLVDELLRIAREASTAADEIEHAQEYVSYSIHTRHYGKKAEADVAEGAAFAASRDAAKAVTRATAAVVHHAMYLCDGDPIGPGTIQIEDAKETEAAKFWADYERIAQAVREQGYTDETLVPPDFFGPL
jgi:hypothetical protein